MFVPILQYPSGDSTEIAFERESGKLQVSIHLEGDYNPQRLAAFEAAAKVAPFMGAAFIQGGESGVWQFQPQEGVTFTPLANLSNQRPAQALLVSLLADFVEKMTTESYAPLTSRVEPKYLVVVGSASKQSLELLKITAPNERDKLRMGMCGFHEPAVVCLCAPEGLKGCVQFGWAQEVYTLGASLLLHFVGSEPLCKFFTGKDESTSFEMVNAVYQGKTLQEKDAFLKDCGLDPALKAFILAAWTVDPAERCMRVTEWVETSKVSTSVENAVSLAGKHLLYQQNLQKFTASCVDESDIRFMTSTSKARQQEPEIAPRRRTYSI